MTALAPSTNGHKPFGEAAGVFLCMCGHADTRHGEDGCKLDRCDCLELRLAVSAQQPPPLGPLQSVEELIAKAKRSPSQATINTARRLERQHEALAAQLRLEAGREAIVQDIVRLQGQLKIAKARLRQPAKPKPAKAKPDKKGKFPCPEPGCDAVAKSAGGLGSHRSAKHGTPGTAAGR